MKNNLFLTLDVDGVLANFHKGLMDWAGVLNAPVHPDKQLFADTLTFKLYDKYVKPELQFWFSLPPIFDLSVLEFVNFDAYVTSRDFPLASSITRLWLEKHGAPLKPVYSGEKAMDNKITWLNRLKPDFHLDDDPKTYSDILLFCSEVTPLLMSRPYNENIHLSMIDKTHIIKDLEHLIDLKKV